VGSIFSIRGENTGLPVDKSVRSWRESWKKGGDAVEEENFLWRRLFLGG